MENRNSKLIGISFSSVADAKAWRELDSITLTVNGKEKFLRNKRFDALIIKWTSEALGIPVEKLEDETILNSYLDKNWSYMRNERFIDNKKGIDRQPVQYHTTPGQVMDKIRYLGREIHANFWINALFDGPWKEEPWIVIDVNYPNEADAILERGGKLYRVDHTPSPLEKRKNDNLAKYPGFSGHFLTTGSLDSLSTLRDTFIKEL